MKKLFAFLLLALSFSVGAIGPKHSGAAPLPLRTHMSLAASSKFGASTIASLTYGTLVFRTKYVFTQDMASLRIEPNNWLYPPDTGNSAFTITAMYLEGGSFSCLLQVKWSGSASTTLTQQTVARNPSDAVVPSQCGLGVFPVGGWIYLREQISATIGAAFPASSNGLATLPSPERAWQFNSATTTFNSVNATGDINVVSGTDYAGVAGSYAPILVGMRNSASTPPALLVVGDSEVDNDGNATYNVDSYIARAARSYAQPVANLTISHGGRSQTQLATDTEWQRSFAYCSVLIDDHGTNAPLDGPSAPQSQLSYYAAIRAAGAQRIFHVGLYPQSTSDLGLTSLTSVATLATGTVADTSHMTNVIIAHANGATTAYNGTYTVTVIDGTHFTYTFAGTSGAAATGPVTASDGWQTLYYQAFNSGNTNANAFNAWIATKVGDGTASSIDGQWSPTSASIRDSSNSNAWKSTGAANAYTNDGLHQNSNGAGNPLTATATEFAAQYTTWTAALLEPAY